MFNHRTEREDRGEEHGRWEDQEDLVRKGKEVRDGDRGRIESPCQVGAEFVGDLDQNDHKWKPQRREREDLDPLPQHVAIENAHYAFCTLAVPPR